ncbi:MAG: DNA repair protein RadA [Sulfurospirillum sp.]|jgi:DNA repair protein RadA/Sms|nr:DNA repair protein RadA [Sulfurospirillum sp.]MBP9613156.1 DNA repair protein RadA [Sulfurospirillum sp.]
MAKKQILFECQACGHQSAKWLGKCPSCGAWDDFIELSQNQIDVLKEINANPSSNSSLSHAIPITDVAYEHIERYSSGDSELDLVLGGGIVQGSLTLIGGSPGVGKSTLLLKIAGNLAREGKKVLYVSGEESSSQIKLRANRVDSNYKDLFLLSEIRLDTIFKELEKHAFEVLVIDSIQTIYSEKISSAPGSVSQVREITFELMRFGKAKNIATFIIGHITKDGTIAGPRVLEHMVDTVLYFEGDSSRELRLLRGFKNRFGTTSEVGIFEMTKVGLVSAKDISKKFFTRGRAQAGSAITVLMEGSRPIVLEVQALVSESSYPTPKRSATGYELNRLTMLLALLERKLDLPFNQYDVYINIAGGIKITETSADLAIIAAIISSYRNRPISKDTIFIGEVSLIGDVRDIFNLDLRLKEAKAQQFEKAVVPSLPLEKIEGIKCYNVDEVSKLIEWM